MPSKSLMTMPSSMLLADDLADVLMHMVVGWKDRLGVDLAEHPEVVRVMARYREAKVQCEAEVRHGPGHQSRTRCEVKGPHQYHYASNPMCPGWEWEGAVAYTDLDGSIRER